METIVHVSLPRSQYRSRSRPTFSDGFITPSPGYFGGASCRAWLSGAGILPSPSFFARSAPNLSSPRSEPPKRSRKRTAVTVTASSGPVCETNACSDDLPSCELWAGPAYSNSPPPSLLPMPKFCVSQKRDALTSPRGQSLSDSGPDWDVPPGAKSAPTSPRGQSLSPSAGSSSVNVLATATLRRVLNLDFDDE